ncbi:MAG: hypothetical protein V4702_05480 [Patescibacteria group bacterium]
MSPDIIMVSFLEKVWVTDGFDPDQPKGFTDSSAETDDAFGANLAAYFAQVFDAQESPTDLPYGDDLG